MSRGELFLGGILGVAIGVYTWKPYFDGKRAERLAKLSQGEKNESENDVSK